MIVGVVAGLLAAAVIGALYRYLWSRLVRDTTGGGSRLRRAGSVVFVVGPLVAVGALVSEKGGAPFWVQRTLAWPGYLWLALSLYLLLAVVVGEIVRRVLLGWLGRRVPSGAGGVSARMSGAVERPAAERPAVERPAVERPVAEASGAVAGTAEEQPVMGQPVMGQPAAERPATVRPPAGTDPATAPERALTTDESKQSTQSQSTQPTPPEPHPLAPSRRLFVSRVVAGAAAAAAVGTVGYGAYGVLRGPRVKRVTIPLAKLPRAAHGFRIAVVSDIHLGPILGRGFTQRVVDTINATQPDMIAVVGDLVDGSVHDLGPAAQPLAGLVARHGGYFVTGNHEYYSGAQQWVEHVRELGLHPLENARTQLPGFDLAGVNDVQGESTGQGPDFAKALGDRDTSRAVVLLAHQPVVIHDAVRHGVDLQLSGHTHGGQLWPGKYLAALANPTVAGYERYGDTQLYVTRGAGAWGPPVRVGAPSDITVVELASRAA